MEKPIFDFSGFLHELDSTEELVEFNVWDYTDKYVIDDKTAQYLTYEYISFYTIDYLCRILENDNWANKKDAYKIYLLNRVSTTCSNLNKAQYLTVLARCFKSNVDVAWRCLKDVFSDYLLKDKYLYTTKRLFDNLSYVGLPNKKYKDELYKFISDTLKRSDISDANLMRLIGWVASSNKFHYQISKISGVFEVCLTLVSKINEPLKRKHIIELALQIREKLKDEDKQKYAAKRKELYELLADNEYSFLLPEDPKNAAVPLYNHMFLRNILQWYTLAGNDIKAAKAEKELREVKFKLNIPSFPVTLYTPEQIDILEQKLEFSHQCPTRFFLWGLSEDFFKTIPSDNALNKSADDFIGPDGFSFTQLDYNNNSENIPDSELHNYKKFLIYGLYAKPSIRNFINVFIQRIKEGTLLYKDIFEFLTSNTNFGKTFKSYRDEPITYYELVEKGLKHLFYQFKKIVSGYTPDFTLSIDSLCPKIERILREMLHSVNARILKIDANSATPKKENMILLAQLLNAPENKNFMKEEDLNFFRYVLTSDGQNIRNDSAHGLYSPSFYKTDAGAISAFMVFVAIIRLAIISNRFHLELPKKLDD